MLEGDAEAARGPCEEAIAIARASGDTAVECNALNTLGAVVGTLGGREQGIALLTEAKRLADELGASDELARSYVNLGQLLDEEDRLEEAAARHPRGVGAAAGPGTARSLPCSPARRARDSIDSAGGTRPRRFWPRSPRPMPPASRAASPVSALAQLEARRGDLDAAETHLERAQRAAAGGVEMYSSLFREAAATVALAPGRPEDVREILTFGDEAGARLSRLRAPRVRARARGGGGARRPGARGHDGAGEQRGRRTVADVLLGTRGR